MNAAESIKNNAYRLNPCKFCGNPKVALCFDNHFPFAYRDPFTGQLDRGPTWTTFKAKCEQCGARTADFDTVDEVVSAWNMKAEA